MLYKRKVQYIYLFTKQKIYEDKNEERIFEDIEKIEKKLKNLNVY